MASRLFDNVFHSGTSGCVRVCSCGRTYFDDSDDAYDWEDGELEQLRENAKNHPDMFIPVENSVATYSIAVNGNEIVIGCQCSEIEPYEKFINQHAKEIAEYLNKKAEGLERTAESIKVKH